MPRRKEFEEHVGVFQSPDPDVWCIRVRGADGTKTVRQVGSYQDAVDAYRNHAAAKLLGITPYIEIMRGPTFQELVEVAADFYKAKGEQKENSFRGKAALMSCFDDRVATTLTTMELENWLLDQADENHWSAATQNNYKYCLIVIFREGRKANLIEKNPARAILTAKVANRRIRFFSEEEEEQIRQVIIDRGKRNGTDWEEMLAEMDIALQTGMRKSEQFGLVWEQVDLDKGIVSLKKTKNGHSRNVFLNKRSKAAFLFLKERNQQHGATDRVFPDGCSTKWFDDVLAEAGIHDAVWYTFRHTTASRLVMQGVHIALVKTIMGHRTLGMTFRYSHLAAGHLLGAVEKIVPPRRPFFESCA